MLAFFLLLSLTTFASTPIDEGRRFGVAENFVQGYLSDYLPELPIKGESKVAPWSGYYWPNNAGGLGFRWKDALFPYSYGSSRDYVKDRPWELSKIEDLSAAEKYDILTGIDPRDPQSLTTHQWNMGAAEYLRTGTVAGWQGICHGWAPASIYMPEPKNPVTIKGITFFPDDIKALGSLLWANGQFKTLYAGVRCNNINPKKNEEGRVLEPNCFDVNPGDWHLILTNLLGLQKHSFIIDAAAGPEVWNHPVKTFEVEFFDVTKPDEIFPDTNGRFREVAMTPHLRFENFIDYNTIWVIGVKSTVLLKSESWPGSTDAPERMETYTYQLELDEDFRIIGGEWLSRERPDFLWKSSHEQLPMPLIGDKDLDFEHLGDYHWQERARINNRRGVPLRTLVEKLFEQSTAM